MAGIGTRAGICPGYIPTPNNTCKLCGKREYQHTFEGNDVPIEIAKSKVPFIELMDPSEGSIYGGDTIVFTGRNFSRIRYNKGLLWAKFGKYKVKLTMDSLGNVECISPPVLMNVIHWDDFKKDLNEHGEICYALEVRLTADGGVTWSNPENFCLKFDNLIDVNKYDASKCYYWGGLKPPDKKKKHEMDKPMPKYDMFLNTEPSLHPHFKYSYTRACYKLMFYLHLATGRQLPKYSFELIKHHVSNETANYPYSLLMHLNTNGEEKLALFKDIFLAVVGRKDNLDPGETRHPGVAKVTDWIKGGNDTNSFRKLLNRALDYLSREEQPVRHIRVTKSAASPHAIVLMENGMIEIQSIKNPSNYSSELLDETYFLSEQELEMDHYRYCRPWGIDDDLKQLMRPEKTNPNLVEGGKDTTEEEGLGFETKKNILDWSDREASIDMHLTMSRLMMLMPYLGKPADEDDANLTLDGNLIAPSGKPPIDKNVRKGKRKKDDDELKVGGWFWSPFSGSVKPKILMDKVACGTQHFCCVTNAMYGCKLYTWGDNGAGQLGRRTSGGKNSTPSKFPAIVKFETMHNGKYYDELQVYSINCGSLYTICACISAVTGQTHIYSFGQPNDEKLPREDRCLPHKVVGLEEASEVLYFSRSDEHEMDLKHAKNREMRNWPKGKSMTEIGKCFKFWPNGLDMYHDTTWEEFLFFRRKQVKEFKKGHDHDHMSIPLLSSLQIPKLFGFEKSQHDNLCDLYKNAIEDISTLISMTDGMIRDLNEINEIDGITFGESRNMYINAQDIVQQDFDKYANLAVKESALSRNRSNAFRIDENDEGLVGGNLRNSRSVSGGTNNAVYNNNNDNNNNNDGNDIEGEETGLVRGIRRSMFLDIVAPGQEVLIRSDIGWLELIDEIHLIKSKTKKIKTLIDEDEEAKIQEIETAEYLEYTLEQIEVVKYEKENPQMLDTPTNTPKTDFESKKSALAPLRRRLSKFSRNEFLPVKGMQTPKGSDFDSGANKKRGTVALQATQKLLTPTNNTKAFTSKKSLRSSQSFVNSRKSMSMKKRVSAFSPEPGITGGGITGSGAGLHRLKRDLKDGLHLLSYKQLTALKARVANEQKLRKKNIMNLHQNIAKSTIEFAYLQKKLEVHEELQTNWVLCDILDFEEELLSPNAQSARVAYRSGKTDFERAIGNAELKWEQLCNSMPEAVVRMYLSNLSILKDLAGSRRKDPFKDILRNLDNVYIDEGANIGYKDFLDCSDLLLGGFLDTLQDWSSSDMSRLNTDEGLKLLQIVFSCCKLRTQINLTQHRKHARIYELEYGQLKRAKADPNTILVDYENVGVDGQPLRKNNNNADQDGDGKAGKKKRVSGKQKMAGKKKLSKK